MRNNAQLNNIYGWDDVLNRLGGNSYLWTKRTLNRLADDNYLDGYGFKVYSQNDEDGILQEIFKRIGILNRTFVEIGVQNGLECNTHYLLFQGWRGVWIEGDENEYWAAAYRFHRAIRQGLLRLENFFVTMENINTILKDSVVSKELDLLSVDIDGNDYFVLKAVRVIQPRVVVVEYNGKYPPPVKWAMPYEPQYKWNHTDIHGASLSAFEEMMQEKGYRLVGTGVNGINAFFVRQDLVGDHFCYALTSENLYNPARLGKNENWLLFQMGEHNADVFVGNGLDVQGEIRRDRLNVMSMSVQMLESLPKDIELFLWGAGVCGLIILRFLQEKGFFKVYFCDTQKTGNIKKIDILPPHEVERRYIKCRSIVLLASCDYLWEMAFRSLNSGIDVVYHVLPLLEYLLKYEDWVPAALVQQYKRNLQYNPLFIPI